MNSRKYAIFSILFLFFLSTLMMLRQLKSPYYFSCFISDTYQYTSWAWQFTEALKEGIIYPRWTPLNFWGYGSPTFVLYPPLAFYLVALFNFFSNSVVAAMNFTKFFSLFIAATGIFFLVREIYPERVALIAGSFYILLPFHIFSMYIGGAFTSSVSSMWFPLILFFTYKYTKSMKYMHLLYAGVCYGGLIFTHIINAYMFTFVIVAFIIYMSIAKRRPKYLIGILLIITTGIVISSAYLLPFIYEKHFIDYQSVIKNFPISYLFILPKYTDNFHADFFWRIFYNDYLSYVILFFVITLLTFLQILKSHHLKTIENATLINGFFIGVSLFSMFLLFGPSLFLWEAIPFFKYINIPARWLNITAFAVVFLSASGFYMLEVTSISKIKRHSLLAIIFIMCILPDYKYISSVCVFDKRESIAINWLPEHLPKGVDTDRINKEGGLKEKVVVIKGEGEHKIVKWKSAERVIEITASKPITLRIRTFNFPGWTAYIDDMQTEIRTEKGMGAMVVNIPEGHHSLRLIFKDTPIRYYSKMISIFSLISILAIFLSDKFNLPLTRLIK